MFRRRKSYVLGCNMKDEGRNMTESFFLSLKCPYYQYQTAELVFSMTGEHLIRVDLKSGTHPSPVSDGFSGFCQCARTWLWSMRHEHEPNQLCFQRSDVVSLGSDAEDKQTPEFRDNQLLDLICVSSKARFRVSEIKIQQQQVC